MSDFKKTGNLTTSDKVAEEATKERQKRKKVYERVRETLIPQEIQELFKAQGYELKFIRWAIAGEEDYKYLARREREGYEFVTKSELPVEYLRSLRVTDTRSRTGLVTMGDLCLMKVDTDLRNSRRKYFQEETDAEVASVDIHILEKKGFRNLGSRSKVIMKEPSFDN